MSHPDLQNRRAEIEKCHILVVGYLRSLAGLAKSRLLETIDAALYARRA
jgi:hypothetical protein